MAVEKEDRVSIPSTNMVERVAKVLVENVILASLDEILVEEAAEKLAQEAIKTACREIISANTAQNYPAKPQPKIASKSAKKYDIGLELVEEECEQYSGLETTQHQEQQVTKNGSGGIAKFEIPQEKPCHSELVQTQEVCKQTSEASRAVTTVRKSDKDISVTEDPRQEGATAGLTSKYVTAAVKWPGGARPKKRKTRLGGKCGRFREEDRKRRSSKRYGKNAPKQTINQDFLEYYVERRPIEPSAQDLSSSSSQSFVLPDDDMETSSRPLHEEYLTYRESLDKYLKDNPEGPKDMTKLCRGLIVAVEDGYVKTSISKRGVWWHCLEKLIDDPGNEEGTSQQHAAPTEPTGALSDPYAGQDHSTRDSPGLLPKGRDAAMEVSLNSWNLLSTEKRSEESSKDYSKVDGGPGDKLCSCGAAAETDVLEKSLGMERISTRTVA